ncbi:MAG: pentapeptide repeat-containing protein [Polyangiaceae bacterium]|nr:pentapeptide repeat-containing protein [Polyangiaceae bacterium]
MTWPIAVSPPQTCDVGTLVFRRGGRLHVTCVVKATFAMVHGGFCFPVDPRPLSQVERPLLGIPGATPEATIETWPAVAKPEVLLWGDAVAPNRDPVRAMPVRMVVWKNGPRLDKTLHVYGPREDERYLPSPFSALPLLWERTGRGAHGDNPAGSREGRPASVIDPARPHAAASFAARGVGWPGRHVPWSPSEPFPPATPWEWPDSIPAEAFNAAPADQRLDTIDGDEWLIFEGMHADLPRFATRLPRAIAAAKLIDSSGPRETFRMAIDTLLIDMTNLQLSVLWRGSIPLTGETWAGLRVEAKLELDAADAPRIDVSLPAEAPTPLSLGRGMRLGESPSGPAAVPAFAASPAAVAAEPPRGDAAPALVEETQDTPAPVEPAEPATTRAPATPAPAPNAAAPNSARAAGSPPSGAVGPPAEPVVETGLRAQVLTRVAAKQPLNDLTLTGADLSNLDLSGATLSGLNLAGVKLTGARLTGARLTNAKLGGADLTQADLTEADLTQADLTRATLVEATLMRAQLLDANLGAVEGRGARFDDARAQRAILAQGKWQQSSFRGADLAGADLSGCELSAAVFDGATLTSARFVDARATGLSARGARLADANLAGASFIDCDLTELDAPRTVWDRTIIDGSSFEGARLESSGFARAHLDRTRFIGATLVKASFMGVTGEAASFANANLEAVDLRQAKLVDANFEGARLPKVNGLKATFSGANLTGADLSGASLRSAKLRAAKLGGSTLRDADLRDADLEGADLRGADRQGAKLAGASLKGALESE